MTVITRVEGVPLRYEAEPYERDALAIKAGSEHRMEIVLIKVETSDGTVGYGESISYGGVWGVEAVINRMLGPLIVGKDPEEINKLWDTMYKASYRLGRRGLVISALSGIDIALWDILGKKLKSPIYRMLGGFKREIRGYVTGGYYREGKGVNELINEVHGYVKEGFNTVKIKVGGLSLDEDVRRVRSLVDEFGDKIRIAVDANNVYDFNTALLAGREFEKAGVIFFEEPIPTDHIDLSAELAKTLDIPIAGYETAYTLYEFRDIVRNRAVDIVQADATWSGGITETIRIGVLARAFGLPLIPHYSAGGVGFVANLHVASVINSPMIEYHLSPNKLREELVRGGIKRVGDKFLLPDGPGLGIEINEGVVDKYRLTHKSR